MSFTLTPPPTYPLPCPTDILDQPSVDAWLELSKRQGAANKPDIPAVPPGARHCPVACAHPCETPLDFWRHFQSEHPFLRDAVPNFAPSCPVACGARLGSNGAPSEFVRHYLGVHLKCKRFSCFHCDRDFTQWSGLKRHLVKVRQHRMAEDAAAFAVVDDNKENEDPIAAAMAAAGLTFAVKRGRKRSAADAAGEGEGKQRKIVTSSEDNVQIVFEIQVPQAPVQVVVLPQQEQQQEQQPEEQQPSPFFPEQPPQQSQQQQQQFPACDDVSNDDDDLVRHLLSDVSPDDIDSFLDSMAQVTSDDDESDNSVDEVFQQEEEEERRRKQTEVGVIQSQHPAVSPPLFEVVEASGFNTHSDVTPPADDDSLGHVVTEQETIQDDGENVVATEEDPRTSFEWDDLIDAYWD